MEHKHTPGPWMVEYMNCHVGQVATCHGDGEGYYEVWTTEWAGGIDQKANAHLIAAAPELLGALEDLRNVVRSNLLPAMNEAAKHLPEGHPARQWSVVDDFVFQEATEKTDNTIAKARGNNQ